MKILTRIYFYFLFFLKRTENKEKNKKTLEEIFGLRHMSEIKCNKSVAKQQKIYMKKKKTHTHTETTKHHILSTNTMYLRIECICIAV